jgi:Flp pilus assembly protein CpaB
VLLSKREKQQNGDGPPIEIVSSQVVVKNVRVLAIDQAPKEKEGQNAVLGKTATLEMTPETSRCWRKPAQRDAVAGAAQHRRQQGHGPLPPPATTS